MGSEEQKRDLPQEGWYDDPEGGKRKRWWDGTQWTDRYTSPAAPRRVDEIDRSFTSLFTVARVLQALGWVTLVLGGIAVVALTIAAASSDPGVTRDAFGNVSRTDPGVSAVVIAVGGTIGVLLYALAFFGAAAMVRLALRVEDNTFRTAAAVERLGQNKPA